MLGTGLKKCIPMTGCLTLIEFTTESLLYEMMQAVTQWLQLHLVDDFVILNVTIVINDKVWSKNRFLSSSR